ncbi:MAG: D-alanyl-D-alanine carboxypeptidase/D-alanyl-D-alanine-endopeptidase [Myxococcaceae bacterium]|nr:D-alanyl-D-alanine carboxypeptidase/D-alanyl-D-alanine-endopeptidase [Myxococcaceae bacterium]
MALKPVTSRVSQATAAAVEVKRGLIDTLKPPPAKAPAPSAFSAAQGPDTRPRAPWSGRAQVLASRALEAAKGTTGDAAIRKAVEALATDPSIAGASLSVSVAALHGGPVIAARGASDDLNPASNSKLATASFAMAVLGADHRFETPFQLDGAGRLCVVGNFDPSLTPARLLDAARALKASGVHTLAGVTLDNSALEGTRTPAHFAEAGDADWEFLAPPEALSVDKNLVWLEVTPGEREGEAGRIRVDQGAFEIRDGVTTLPGGSEFHLRVDEQDVHGTLVRNAKGQAIIDVTGDIASSYTKGKALKMKSPDPVASFADKLLAALQQAGIEVKGPVLSGKAPADARTVFTSRSAPLAELLKASIAESNAFDHEMYALAAARAQRGSPTISLEQATAELGTFLHREVGLESFRFDNASGIGNANRLSSDDVLKILRKDAQDPRFRPIFDGLARPGQPGSTLGTRMLGTPAEGSLRAKTGTLGRIVALSGVVGFDGPRPLGFSVLLNGLEKGAPGRETGRAFVDAMGIVLATLNA